MHEVCEVSESQEQSAKYAPFPLCRDPYSESSANIRIMFERTKVLSKKSSLSDKIHQNLPSLRDFSAFLSFSSHKSFEQEGEEVGEGVKLAIETDVLIAELDAVSDVGIFTILSC